ncbi:hypothetical protein WJX72_003238 [[Myrmecia] bisecta]|uniref:Acyl-[acyl-carrier-protein] hydrolase n=1 Tax=[Myrmecia] bisecta TaxID=41462 RepID=A0AAW1PP46_9CHLO
MSVALPAPRPGRLIYQEEDPISFKEEHRIRSYEVGPDQQATITTVANLLQEVAGNHGVAVWGRTEEGFATDPIMVEKNLIFVATRIQIQMDKYPRWGDVVSVETWFQAEGRVAACRNWVMKNALTGEELGRSTSTWVMVNTVTRRLAKIPEEMRCKLVSMAPKPPRDAICAEEARHKLPDFTLPPEITGPKQVARRSDMDMNGHINNVTYLALALETVPINVFQSHSLKQVEVDYKAECKSGQTLESLGNAIQEDTNGSGIKRFVHMLRRCDEKGECTELVRARTTWAPDYDKIKFTN